MGKHDKRIRVLQRTAKEIRNYRVRKKILTAALVLLVSFVLLLYGMSVMYTETGSFTISIKDYEMTKYGLSLSESRELTYLTSQLNAKAIDKLTNINGKSIPENVNMVDGSNNGDNYIAYTFYLQNAGEFDISCDYEVVMSNITNGMDSAIRLRLYINDEYEVYAKTRTDGTGPEPGTTEFYSADVMARGRISDLVSKDNVKFTVVLWIEGTDPDCVDSLIGGDIKVDMNFSIVH